jgi:hypothetical protein
VSIARFRWPTAVGGVAVALAFITGAMAGGAAGETAAWPTCFGSAPTKVGTLGRDVIVATDRNDVILARGGNDVIFGAGGSDRICAGGGRDSVLGGAGNDRIDGGPGNDLLLADPGSGEVVFGGPGTDTCSASRILRGCEVIRRPTPPPPSPPPAPTALPRFVLGAIECLSGPQLRAYPPREMLSVYDVNLTNPEIVRWWPVLQVANMNRDWVDYDTTRPVYQAFTSSYGFYEDAYGNGGWQGPDNQKLGFVTYANIPLGTYRIRNYLYWQKLDKWYYADSNQYCPFF